MNATMMDASASRVEVPDMRVGPLQDARTVSETLKAARALYDHVVSSTQDDTDGAAAPSKDANDDYVAATFLDALPLEADDAGHSDKGYISAVNSDDNGLYRMFRNLSP